VGCSCNCGALTHSKTMLKEETNKENWLLGIDEPVEFETQLVEVQDFMKIAAHFRGFHRVCVNSITNNRKMSTCHGLDLETIRFRPIMSKILL
jgi:hypothetical protein